MPCERSCIGTVHPPEEACCHTCACYDGEICIAPEVGYFPKHYSRYLWG